MMAIFAAVFGDGLIIGVRPRVGTPAIPAGIGEGVRTELPTFDPMTGST